MRVFTRALRQCVLGACVSGAFVLAEAPDAQAAVPIDSHEPLAPSWWETSKLGLHGSFSAALDNPAFAAAVGARYEIGPWLIGADVEYNPWISIPTTALRPGTLNIFATGIRRWNMRAHSVKLRTTAHVGASVLLFDLYGAPMGSVGPYLGLSLLGIEVAIARGAYLLFEPADVAIPVPQINGAPLTYHQYRATVGLQFGG